MPKAMLPGQGKYRLRTWLRIHLPYFLSDRIPKGPKDCGKHVWYRSDDETLCCYHCEVGVRHVDEPATRRSTDSRPEAGPRIAATH